MDKHNLVGQKINRWLVVAKAPTKHRSSRFLCACDCGNISIVEGKALKKGTSKSCGCFQIEKTKSLNKKEYKYLGTIRRGMIERCQNKKHKAWKYYGAKGIAVCEEWANSYKSFRKWALSNGFKVGLTIDRIDPNKNYEPSNCRFISKQENSARCNVKLVTVNGKKYRTTDFMKEFNISSMVYYYWRKKGLNAQQIYERSLK